MLFPTRYLIPALGTVLITLVDSCPQGCQVSNVQRVHHHTSVYQVPYLRYCTVSLSPELHISKRANCRQTGSSAAARKQPIYIADRSSKLTCTILI